MKAKVLLENGKTADIILTKDQIELINKKEVPEIPLKIQIGIAIDKLLAKGYKECSFNFDKGIIKAGIDRSVHDFEKYLERYQIPKNSVFYYQERGNYCDVITFGLGMKGIKGKGSNGYDGYINGSAYIDNHYIINSIVN